VIFWIWINRVTKFGTPGNPYKLLSSEITIDDFLPFIQVLNRLMVQGLTGIESKSAKEEDAGSDVEITKMCSGKRKREDEEEDDAVEKESEREHHQEQSTKKKGKTETKSSNSTRKVCV